MFYPKLTKSIFKNILSEIDFQKSENLTTPDQTFHKKKIFDLLKNNHTLSEEAKQVIVKEVLSMIFGLGQLEPLLRDENISEIMVNGKDRVFTEKFGILQKTNITFPSEEDLINIINRIVGRIGRRIDEESPLVDARLPDGSRVNAIIRPLSLQGPILTIRKFPKTTFTLDLLLKNKSITKKILNYLKKNIINKKNIVIVGGTGSGKTSTLNALVNSIPETERLITIEDSAEIQTSHPHRIALESRPPNIENRGAITIRKLLRNALRMRPDRIIVGEIRGAECLDMLQAMNTGHQGSLSTIHANSELEGLIRIETMALMANVELPFKAIRQQVIQAIDIIVYQQRLSTGQRIISSISEISKENSNTYLLKKIF